MLVIGMLFFMLRILDNAHCMAFVFFPCLLHSITKTETSVSASQCDRECVSKTANCIFGEPRWAAKDCHQHKRSGYERVPNTYIHTYVCKLTYMHMSKCMTLFAWARLNTAENKPADSKLKMYENSLNKLRVLFLHTCLGIRS